MGIVAEPAVAPRGLKGLIVADTTVGDVRGEEGYFHYRGHDATALARHHSFEDVWHLVARGRLPEHADESVAFASEVRALRSLPANLLAALPAIVAAAPDAAPLDHLRTAVSLTGSALGFRATVDIGPAEVADDALRMSALVPTLIAALHRIRLGEAPIEPHPDLGWVAGYLWMVTGEEPTAAEARAVEQYLILTIDHGFNASTFTGRVVTSTGADLAAAVVAAMGALSGPLHGGAPSRCLDTLDAIGDPANTEAWVEQAVAADQRIMGFGHAVYRTVDPRSALLKEVAIDLGGERVDTALQIEEGVVEALNRLKPGRKLYANVELYAGVVMERCGLARDLFTPTFVASRVVGWTAHVCEQAADGKIIRPLSRYVGDLHQ